MVNWATASVIIPAGVTIVIPLLTFDIFGNVASSGASPVTAITLSEAIATLVLILVAGLLANDPRVIVATTITMNVFTIFILSTALQRPGAGAALRPDALILITFPLLAQWAVAGVLLVAAGTYLRTLRELGDVRVAYARARQLDELKDQFISHVNHELRSPIMAMQGYVELLQLTDESLSSEERAGYLRRAKHAGDDLVALVTSILAVHRMEQDVDQVELRRVVVDAALRDSLQLIDPREAQPAERELRLRVPEALEVWADPVKLRQILTNLLSNALKYSPPVSPIEISAGYADGSPTVVERRPRAKHTTAPTRRMVSITVRDYGLGIPPDQLPLLFNRFVRLPRDLASNVAGNGLGLYLCQKLAHAMGGEIRVESTGREGEGSRFQLLLPSPATPVVGA
jgi:signal transduction histidine kinase